MADQRSEAEAMISGGAIRQLRKVRGMSQARLALEAGIPQEIVAELEAGGQETSEYLPAVAAALGVTVGELRDDTAINTLNAARTDGLSINVEALQELLLAAFEGLGVLPPDARVLAAAIIAAARRSQTRDLKKLSVALRRVFGRDLDIGGQ
jgi:transcriptional regulator with XRE-family HTH domain